MLVNIIFSVSVLIPHEMPSSAQVRYYFDHNSGTTEPILMNFFLNTHNQILYNNAHEHFFCICHISQAFLKKPLRHPNLTTSLPISPEPQPHLLILERSINFSAPTIMPIDNFSLCAIF